MAELRAHFKNCSHTFRLRNGSLPVEGLLLPVKSFSQDDFKLLHVHGLKLELFGVVHNTRDLAVGAEA